MVRRRLAGEQWTALFPRRDPRRKPALPDADIWHDTKDKLLLLER